MKDLLPFLKKNCKRIYYFGLGFIQVVVGDELRYHFYSPKFPVIVEQPHNHRYNFSSHVLKGALHQEIFDIKECPEKNATHILYKESCNPDKEAPKGETFVKVKKIFSSTFEKESTYEIEHDAYHRVQAIGPTITKLTRSGYKKEFADVVRPVNTEHLCPFSLKVSEDELWEIIEEMI